jgi:hypothetical protein
MWRARQAAGCLLIVLFAACSRDAEKRSITSGESVPRPAAPRVAAVPYEPIGRIDEIHTGVVVYLRVIIRIAIATGYTQEQVHATLQQVAEATSRKLDADEVLVFAYRSASDVYGPYNVARAAYDRDWELGSSEREPFVVDLDPSYLTAEASPVSPRTRPSSGVTLLRESYGGRWPFPKHESAVLDCEIRVFRGTLRPFDIVELGGARYGLNSTAVEVGGYPSAWPFIIRDPTPPDHPGRIMEGIHEKISEICRAKVNSGNVTK